MLLSLCLWVDSTMQGSKKKHEHVGRDVGTPKYQQVYFAFRAVITSLLSWVVSMSLGQLWGLCLSHSLLSLSAWRLLSKFVIGRPLIWFYLRRARQQVLKECLHMSPFLIEYLCPLLKRMAGSCLIIWERLFHPQWRQDSSDPCHLYDELCSKLSCWPKIGAVFLMPGRLNVIDFARVLFFADSGPKAFNRTVELCHSISMKSNWEWWASLDNFHGQWLMKCWLHTGSSKHRRWIIPYICHAFYDSTHVFLKKLKLKA